MSGMRVTTVRIMRCGRRYGWYEGILNGDGTPLHEHASWDDYWQWWEARQKEGDHAYNIRQS